jgi:anti-sigma factor RsiW
MNAPDRPPRHLWTRLLAAYADGELDAATRARVEDWLAANPDARADLDAQCRLGPRGPLWKASAAPDPGPAAWDAVLARVRREVGVHRPTASRRSWARGLMVALPAAAAVLAAVHLSRPPAPTRPAPEAPWPVTAEDDVEILSLQEADAGLLVVGAPPLVGRLTLASAADVNLIGVEADDDGTLPHAQWPDGAGDAPMVVAPLPREP